MKTFIKIFITLSLLLTMNLFASLQQTQNIANISAVSLYNINKTALQDVIKAYIKTHPNLKALKITESLSGETYVELYRKDNKTLYELIPNDIANKYKRYVTIAKYENEEVGQIVAYFENKNLISLTNKEQEWLENNKIVLSVDDRYAPMNFRNSKNEMDGLSIDYIKMIEKKIGYTIQLDTNAWPVSLDNAMKHQTDGIINANSTPQRDKKLLFTEPYAIVPMVLVSSNTESSYSSLEQLKNKIILVKEKTVEASVLPKKYPSLIVKEVPTYEEALMMVSSGKASGVFGHMAVLEYEMHQFVLPNLKKNFVSFDDVVTKQSIGVRNTAPILRDILNKAIASISKSEKKKISLKWMGSIIDNKGELSFQEVRWIKQNPIINIAVVDSYPPYDFRDENGRLIGFHSDIVTIMNRNLGTNIVLKPYSSWKEAFNAAAKGSVHGIFSLSWSREREEKYFIYSSPYHFSPYYLVVDSSNKKIRTLQDLANKKIAIEENTIFKDVVLEKVPNAKIVYVSNTQDAYVSVLEGETLATISPNISDERFKTSGLKIASEIFHKSSNLYIGINKQYPIAASILTKGIDSISLKELSSLRQKWLTKNNATIELNAKEKAWIRDNPTVKMIEFFDEPPFTLNGKIRQGYIYELLEYLIKSAGLEVDYASGFRTYSEMLSAIEKGKADVLTTFPTSLNLGKASNLVKSKAILKTPFVIIGKSNDANVKSIRDLYGKRVAVVKGYVQDKHLSKFSQIKKVYVNNNDEGFAAIRNGVADYYVNNRANTEFILNKSFFTDLQIIYELPYDKFPPLSISFAMNGKKEQLVSILNKALEQIPYKKLKSIRDKWILQTDSNGLKKVVFTEKEKAWLLDNPAIRFAYMDYWPVDDNRDNIHTEYVGLLSKYGNVNITLVKYDSWKKGFEDAVKGKNSFGILNLSWSKNREEKSFDYTKPYFFTPGYIVVKKSDKKIKSIEDLANKSVYLKENAITNQIVKEVKYNISPINLKNEELMYKALAQDNAEAPALLTYVYNPELLDKYDLKVANKFFSKFGEVHIGVSKNQPELYSILNKIYTVIPKNELSRIQNKVYKKTKKIRVELTKEEKEFIKTHKTIRVHNEKNWPPFNYHEFGQPKGYSIDLMKQVAKNTGLNIEFITGPTWDEFLQMMKKDELDVVINIVQNDERLKYMDFTDPFIQATMGIAVHEETQNIKSFNDMLDKKVALEKGFFYHDYFKKNHKDTQLVVVDNGIQTLQSVAFKQADSTIGFVPVMKYIAQKNFITGLRYFTDNSSPIMQPMPLRFSVSKDNRALLSILQKGLASITPEEQKQLAKRWLGESTSDKKIKVELNKAEQKWLREHQTIRFTADPHYMPYEEFDSNGNYTGMVADYLKIIENTLNIKFEKIPTKTWSESLALAKNAKVDVLSNYTIDTNLEDIHTSTKPYISSPVSIITKDNVQSDITLDDLKGKKVAVISGYGYLNNIFVKHPNLNYITVENAKEGLQGVSLGKYDAIICSLTLAKYKIANLGLHNLQVAGQTGEIMRLGLGVRKDWDIFVDMVNKVLEATTPGMKQEINQKWLGDNFEAAKNVTLTSKEQAWVDQKIPIKYVFDPDWAPFEWKNELNEHTGIIYDILSLLSQRTGLIFAPVATETWSDAVKLAETREVDMYGGLGENEDRKEYMTFTKNSLYKTPYVFVVNKNNNKDYFDTFNSLSANERIAVVDGYTIHGIMKDKQPDINIRTVSSTKEGFKQLSQNKIDIFLVNAATARYYINRNGFEDLKIATKTEYQLEIKSAIRDDWPPEVISIIDKALETLSDKELADIYIKWTELQVEKKVDWELIYQIGAGALALLLLIAYWNRKLKKAVDSKTAELKKLLESFDENVIASKTDTRGVIKYASKAFCEISGYTEEELLGQPQCIVRHPDMPKSLFKDLWTTIQSGKVWRGEVKNRKKEGGFYWVEAIISPEFDEAGKIIGYSAIRHDITAKKEVEEKQKILNTQKRELEKMLEIFDEHIISSKSDLEGHITAASTAFAKITGYEVEELIGLPHSAVRHPDMPSELFEDLWGTIQSGKTWRGEIKNKTKEGGYYWVDALVEPEFDDDGNITGYSALRQDITARKEVEELSANLEIKVEERTHELKEAQEQFSSMAANVPGVIYRCKVDAGWTMLYISNEIEKLSGYPVSDFINNSVRSFADIMHKDDLEPVATLIQNQIDMGEKFLVDYRVIDNQGVVKWVRSQGQAYKTDEGEEWLDGVLFDVTEQKKLEEEILESEKRFVTLFDAAPDSIAIIKDGQYIACNKKTLDIFGVENEEAFMQSKPADYSPKVQECGNTSEVLAPQRIQTAIDEGYHRFEWIHKRIDTDESFDAEVILSSITLGGEPHIYAVVRDITERKELERQIRQNKLFVDTLLDSQEQIVITTDGHKLRSCNKAFLEFFSLENMEEFTKEYDCICDRFEPDETNTYLQKYMGELSWIEHILANENEIHQAVIVKDGYERTFTVTAAVLPLGDGDIKSAVFTDITEIETIRKNIETILSNIMLPVLITSKNDRKILYANDYASKQYEANIDDLVGKSIDSVYTSMEQKDEILSIMTEQGYVENLEERYKTQTGKEFIGLLSVKPILYNGEEAYIGMVVDITEQKEIEEEIRAKEEQIRALVDAIPSIIFMKNEKQEHILINDYFSKVFGLSHDEVFGKTVSSFLSGEAEQLIIEQDTKVLEGEATTYEEVLPNTQGDLKDYITHKVPIRDSNGKVSGMVGIATDISKQKEIEEEIREIHKHTQSSIEYASLIQHSLIPSNETFRKYFDDYFTIWHPKDIVGGDIYLFEELRNEDECLLMVIDCTGHGVPGAFVTMLVKAIERQVAAIIATEPNMEVSPGWILQYFNQTMKKLLKQESDDAISNAGFDGAVLYYNRREQIVRFAGAELPLFYTDEGEFKTIKGNRHSIGYKKSDANFEFKEHIIEAKEGMQFYLTSDGYLDQNGGEKGFPFGKKRFMNLLEEYKDYSFADQQEVLLNALADYQQDEERNDDITLVGVKIGHVENVKSKIEQVNEDWTI